MRTIALLFLLLPASLSAFAAQERVLRSGQADYTVNFVTKTVRAQSREVKGKVVCHEVCEFLLAIPVKSFDSGDTNRDLNMMATMNAATHPVVTARGQFPQQSWDKDEFVIDAVVSLNGVEASYPVTVAKKGQSARFDLDLKRHRVELPSLFAISISPIVPLSFEFDWR